MEFEFYLAEKLRMPVGEMRERMSQAEYVQWQAYYALRAQRSELEQKKAERGR